LPGLFLLSKLFSLALLLIFVFLGLLLPPSTARLVFLLFILDSIVQVIGYYLWDILRIGFHTDAFERLGTKGLGLGGNPSGPRG